MAVERLLPANESVVLIPATERAGVPQGIYEGGIQPIDTITSDLINAYFNVKTYGDINAKGGGNISCAIKDDMELGLTDSDSDDERTLCSVGQSEELTAFQFQAVMNAFRDADLTGQGVFNLAYALTFGPDVPFIIAHRVGYTNDTEAEAGQRWDFYYVWTDVQIPQHGDATNLSFQETFIPKSIVNFGYTLAA